jgi:SAM-dependent methyltransferase
MERHRIISLWLDAHPEVLAAAGRVLHIAPEPPLTARLVAHAVQYVTADLNSRLAALHCDIQDLPLRDDWFDLVVCNHVLEHVPDDRQAMRELYRVLSPGGRAIVMCPIARGRTQTLEDDAIRTPAERLAVYGQEDHARLYGSDYADRLTEAGFRVEVDRFLETLDEPTSRRHVLRRSDDMFETDDIYVAVKAG